MIDPITKQGIMISPARFAQSIVGTDLVDHSFYSYHSEYKAGANSIFRENTARLISTAYPALCANYISDVLSWLPDMLDKWLYLESAKYHAEQRDIEADRLTPAKTGPFNY